MADQHTQIAVLGGGPGGYPAAFAAADHGMKVVLIDEGVKPGGVCLNRGCIPSKALLHVAKLINEAKEAAEYGLTFGTPSIDIDKLRTFKNHVIGSLTGGIEGLCKARGVELIKARGTFLNSDTLELKLADGSKKTLSFDHCIVAAGSLPAMPPIFAIGDDRVMDSTGALELKDVPKRMLVIGGGYIGLEMGSVYSALGTEVTVVEMTSGLLPGADRDLVTPLQKRLTQQLKAIYVNTKVAKLEATPEGIVASLEGEGVEPRQVFDRVLVSVGRRPNSRGLGLENTKAQLDERGFIKIDRNQRSSDPKLLAIGDIAGEPMLAHKATREAKIAVETLAGEPVEFDNIAIPAVVFTDPEVAWAGITETEAKNQNRDVQVYRFPWAASGRAQTLARTEGVTKIIVEPTKQRVLGVGLVGPGAGEMIAEAALAIEMGATARDLADTIHAHPTLAETVMEAAEGIIGQPTHRYIPKKK
ncbi:MAG: dihydrolipoyl dehydrogenase [Planctomycetaceae bacterium]|nr:dihydrolipoyl dehydrogenase [Planctomycetaceae bacterium]